MFKAWFGGFRDLGDEGWGLGFKCLLVWAEDQTSSQVITDIFKIS